MSDNSVAQDQIVAFVDRIMRLKEEAKAINADIREIYAEAKGSGFDKTVLGKLVVYVEKRSSDPNQLNETEAIFDLYLEAYDSAKGRVGTPRATHTHASDPLRNLQASTGASTTMSVGDATIDMATGEIIEPVGTEFFAESANNEPQPETAEQSCTDTIDLQSTSVDAPGCTSFAGAEGDEGQHPIQPETAVQSAEPEKASAEDGRNVEAAGGAAPVLTHSIPASPEPPSTLAGEGGGISAGVAPLNNSSAGREVPRAPGATWLERCPTAPVRWHELSRCFPELWGPGRAELSDDIRANGVKCSIVKIGDDVLDGRARYTIARELGIEYPVTEYAGSDPLADVIRWNLAARALTANERKAIANKLMKLPSVAHRVSEIMEMLGLEAEVAA
ncbi:GapR family DNA-binding domain-containing protein [Paradevosia shaoguanensis]|uniref:GapR family DNA-binding domain-containing protein n=1 Tax=Paradevosia shaoguanensis TaxID=1335043 RepID=UPI0019318552|nr:GapR family DNA-binding domain-containing protein [Paradevosia shaoguanensis]